MLIGVSFSLCFTDVLWTCLLSIFVLMVKRATWINSEDSETLSKHEYHPHFTGKNCTGNKLEIECRVFITIGDVNVM